VAQAFAHEGLPNPIVNPLTNRTYPYLTRIIRGYRNTDPGIQHQLAIPFDLIKAITSIPAETNTTRVFHQLILLAFFFTLRSCEYLQVGKYDPFTFPSRRTHPLRKRNFRFWCNHRLVPHTDPNLHTCDSVTLDFEFQKTDVRDESVTQSRTNHPIFCPVKAAAARIRSMHQDVDRGFLTNDSFVFEFMERTGKKGTLTGRTTITMLRRFITTTNY
jgi:hypothetical protein